MQRVYGIPKTGPGRGDRPSRPVVFVAGGGGGYPRTVIFSVFRFTFDAESFVVTTTVATRFLRARRAFLMALRVFLVNVTLTVLAFPGWRVREAFLPLKRSAFAERSSFFFGTSCLIAVVNVTLQPAAAFRLSFSPFCLRSLCALAALMPGPQAAWRAPRTTWLPPPVPMAPAPAAAAPPVPGLELLPAARLSLSWIVTVEDEGVPIAGTTPEGLEF